MTKYYISIWTTKISIIIKISRTVEHPEPYRQVPVLKAIDKIGYGNSVSYKDSHLESHNFSHHYICIENVKYSYATQLLKIQSVQTS